jgi:hypothetical protein
MGILPSVADRFERIYSTQEIIEAGTRGPRVRGHHTQFRHEQKKRKVPVAINQGLVGKETSVLSGGDLIEREGRRKHWRDLEDEEGMKLLDEDERVEGELLSDGEVDMDDTQDADKGS